MNKKRRTVAFVIFLFILVAILLVYIFSELYTEKDFYENMRKTEELTDAMVFKNEYEELNNKETGDEHLFRKLDVDVDNPFIYKNASDIVELIDDEETFLVFFGYPSCPWCRSVLASLIEAANDADIDEILYVDIKDIRDEYVLDDEHNLVKSKDGDEGYLELLDRLSNILPTYEALSYTNKKGKVVNVKIDEKRIYAPSLILVIDGKAVAITDGISELQTDAYMNITKEIHDDSKTKFKELFNKYNQDRYTTECSEFMC